jgi:hypothetical protein
MENGSEVKKLSEGMRRLFDGIYKLRRERARFRERLVVCTQNRKRKVRNLLSDVWGNL